MLHYLVTCGALLAQEALPPEKFREVHAPILQPKPSRGASELTEQLRPSGGVRAGASVIARKNFVDQHIFGKMARDHIAPAPLATDEEFLRRASLDLTGRIPEPAEVRAYTADQNPAKRDKLIDKLIASDAFADKWAYFFMDLFRANGKMGRGQQLFHYWVKELLKADAPYDDMARQMMAASGKSNHLTAAANVIAREHVQGKPHPDDGDDWGMVQQLDTHDELAVLWGRVFLGVNLACVSCHDGRAHLEKVNVYLTGRKRSEFFQFAAFQGQVGYMMHWANGQPISGEFTIVDDAARKYETKSQSMIRVPRFGGAGAEPAFFLTGEKPQPGEEPREALGRMLTAHPQFARATANMFWAKLMGFGIVEPFDDFDLARQDPAQLPAGWDLQPSHPELLDALARDFRSHGFRLKRLVAAIAKSNAYALSAGYAGEWKESYARYFARKFVRQLGAEEVHDAIVLATNRPGEFKHGGDKMPMAMQVSGPAGGSGARAFLTVFGQSNRSNPPKTPVGTPLQPMMLMHSPVVNDRVQAKKDSRVERLLTAYADNQRVVEELFLATVSRLPSTEEKVAALEALKADRVKGAENLQWALINRPEFLFNH